MKSQPKRRDIATALAFAGDALGGVVGPVLSSACYGAAVAAGATHYWALAIPSIAVALLCALTLSPDAAAYEIAAAARAFSRFSASSAVHELRAARVSMEAKVTEIMMPALSSTMTEGKISQWLMGEGDKVESGDMVLVVESDKADMDVESYEEGYIAKILVPEGESAPVGAPGAAVAATKPWPASVSSVPPPAGPPDGRSAKSSAL